MFGGMFITLVSCALVLVHIAADPGHNGDASSAPWRIDSDAKVAFAAAAGPLFDSDAKVAFADAGGGTRFAQGPRLGACAASCRDSSC